MTSNSRPDLSGLFSGTTAPSRSSSVADAIGPRLLTVTTQRPDERSRPAAGTATGNDRSGRSTPLGRNAPVAIVERYFALLQLVLDVNRDVAIGCVSALTSLPKRAGLRR